MAGPVGYSGWLVALAFALLVVVAGFWLAVLLLWRRGRARPDPGQQVPDPDPASWRAQVDEVEAAWRRGQSSSRAVHLRLGEIVRGYAAAQAGDPSRRAMTATELRAGGQPGVAAVVGSYYPGEFEAVPTADPAAAIAHARRLVG